MFDRTLHDLRFAIRQLGQSKGFTVTAILTLALGIGANTAIFTLVHAVMLRSLPVADPRPLVSLGNSGNCCGIGARQSHFSIFAYPLYTYLRDQTPQIDQMAAFQAGRERVGVRRQGSASERASWSASPSMAPGMSPEEAWRRDAGDSALTP